jgi:hypothetical protein
VSTLVGKQKLGVNRYAMTNKGHVFCLYKRWDDHVSNPSDNIEIKIMDESCVRITSVCVVSCAGLTMLLYPFGAEFVNLAGGRCQHSLNLSECPDMRLYLVS